VKKKTALRKKEKRARAAAGSKKTRFGYDENHDGSSFASAADLAASPPATAESLLLNEMKKSNKNKSTKWSKSELKAACAAVGCSSTGNLGDLHAAISATVDAAPLTVAPGIRTRGAAAAAGPVQKTKGQLVDLMRAARAAMRDSGGKKRGSVQCSFCFELNHVKGSPHCIWRIIVLGK
tara:strand:- start:483 stop:1019 length:537 start_codon:yes stop_codon:yes gene_type:complete